MYTSKSRVCFKKETFILTQSPDSLCLGRWGAEGLVQLRSVFWKRWAQGWCRWSQDQTLRNISRWSEMVKHFQSLLSLVFWVPCSSGSLHFCRLMRSSWKLCFQDCSLCGLCTVACWRALEGACVALYTPVKGELDCAAVMWFRMNWVLLCIFSKLIF